MKLHTQTYTPPASPSADSFAAFLRENNIGWMGNHLVNGGFIRSEQIPPYHRNQRKRSYNNAIDWWKYDEPVVIDWDRIRAACQSLNNREIRGFGKKKLYLLGVYFFGASPVSACPFCGR